MNYDETKVTLKIESAIKGHETITLSVNQAVSRIETETTESQKWLYCDGRFTQVNLADNDGMTRLKEALTQAKDITLAGTLLGG